MENLLELNWYIKKNTKLLKFYISFIIIIFLINEKASNSTKDRRIFYQRRKSIPRT